jgi:hypothetical protein
MKSIQLSTSVKHGNEEIRELNFREPTARDLRRFEFSDLNKFSKIIELSSILSGLPESVLDQLKMEDLFQCVKVIASFLPQSQETLGNI